MANKHSIRIKNTLVEIWLCDEGQRLHDTWCALLAAHAEAGDIHQAMKDYYFHRNGVQAKNGAIAIEPCSKCKVTIGDEVQVK